MEHGDREDWPLETNGGMKSLEDSGVTQTEKRIKTPGCQDNLLDAEAGISWRDWDCYTAPYLLCLLCCGIAGCNQDSINNVCRLVVRMVLDPISSILLWLFWKFEGLSAASLGQLMDIRSLTFGNVSILVVLWTLWFYFWPNDEIKQEFLLNTGLDLYFCVYSSWH